MAATRSTIRRKSAATRTRARSAAATVTVNEALQALKRMARFTEEVGRAIQREHGPRDVLTIDSSARVPPPVDGVVPRLLQKCVRPFGRGGDIDTRLAIIQGYALLLRRALAPVRRPGGRPAPLKGPSLRRPPAEATIRAGSRRVARSVVIEEMDPPALLKRC